MTVLLCLLIATATLAPWTIRRLGCRGFPLLALPLAAGAAWTGSHLVRHALSETGSGHPILVERFEWMPAVYLDIVLRLGPLESLFGTLVLTVGVLVLVYCGGYFHDPPPGKRRRLGSFATQMVLFAAAMYGLVVSDNMLLMYVFWEITSVLSFLLVGYYAERASSRRSAGQALLVTTLGGLVMLVGIILMGHTTGYWEFSALTAPDALSWAELHDPAIATAVVLLVLGALTKSAIAPFHFWLPGAMAAPTPVSAFLHSAAMVKAGVFLVARLSPTFGATTTWHMAIIPLGLVTMVMAGWMALRQKDLKLVLAYGTVSQLGFIITVTSIGTRAAMLAALALTLGHAMFKATLFMIVGAIDHTTGTRDVRQLSGLGARRPQMFIIAGLAAASMAGVPPLFGFVAKEAALDAVLQAEPLRGMPGVFTAIGLVVGSILTVAYSLYLMHAAFATKPSTHASGGGISQAVADMQRPSPLMLAPAWLLALAGVLTGLLPRIYDAAIRPYLSEAFPDAHDDTHLALWHGFNVPLMLTAAILLTGLILHWQRKLIRELQFEKPALGDADVAYDWILDMARRLSLRVTAFTQRGSLPLTEATILGVFILLPISALVLGGRDDLRMELWDNAPQGAAALLIIIAALASTRMRNRLSGVIMVGVTGYGLALVFALYGAPDLALTQLLVETITMVVFVLVLRTLPPKTSDKPTGLERSRAWLAIAVGATAAIIGAFAIAARSKAPVSDPIPRIALEEGHGANAVNVLLVDIRAWDTFGEISVLVIVAVGIASLVFRTHTVHNLPRVTTRRTRRERNPRWLSTSGSQVDAGRRPLMVEVSTRFLFPSMMALSLYLLFAGHNAPGGGFAGGLVASLAITLRYLAGGRWELAETIPWSTDKILGSGLAAAALAVFWPMLIGWPPLSSHIVDLELPLIGDMHLVSPLLFDLGVYLIVIGTVTYILRSLGGRIDVETDRRAERARSRRVTLTKLGRTRQFRYKSGKEAAK
ncbi:Na+/H+ antiporter subunit A [Corynebacterium freneyi]|uniref:Monovalent cation/H+ antiporter subunit A n=1 Tax=Corynebacterium freneyi DNF00450 TaxID=1287475 RepID=A0A095Y2M5_9CORY|nr:Na+/H+ antiporter subunit A [Corynebacterium freneyi]KGF16508.1 monovalent cation/H+ antiporter subunit A [Corynebacterium freneyi DNF00450]